MLKSSEGQRTETTLSWKKWHGILSGGNVCVGMQRNPPSAFNSLHWLLTPLWNIAMLNQTSWTCNHTGFIWQQIIFPYLVKQCMHVDGRDRLLPFFTRFLWSYIFYLNCTSLAIYFNTCLVTSECNRIYGKLLFSHPVCVNPINRHAKQDNQWVRWLFVTLQLSPSPHAWGTP